MLLNKSKLMANGGSRSSSTSALQLSSVTMTAAAMWGHQWVIVKTVLCHWLELSACRHRHIICPVIPDPSVIFKEMLHKGNKVFFEEKMKTCLGVLLSSNTYCTTLFCSPRQRACTGLCPRKWKPLHYLYKSKQTAKRTQCRTPDVHTGEPIRNND